jgi:hypothetical protein
LAPCVGAFQVAQVRAGRAPGPSINRVDLTMDAVQVPRKLLINAILALR